MGKVRDFGKYHEEDEVREKDILKKYSEYVLYVPFNGMLWSSRKEKV